MQSTSREAASNIINNILGTCVFIWKTSFDITGDLTPAFSPFKKRETFTPSKISNSSFAPDLGVFFWLFRCFSSTETVRGRHEFGARPPSPLKTVSGRHRHRTSWSDQLFLHGGLGGTSLRKETWNSDTHVCRYCQYSPINARKGG